MPKTADPFVAAAFAGRAQSTFPIIDAHGHLGSAPDFPLIKSTPEGLVASMDALGIRFTCVSSINAIFGDATGGNRTVRDAIRRFPERFFGYMVVDVGYPERILPEMRRCLTAGFRGVKVWSYGARPGLPYNHPNYQHVFSFANEHRLPLLAHVFGPELAELEPSIQKFPHIRWLLAHIGSRELEGYKRFARQYPNVYVELCLSLCPRNFVEHLVADGLEDKVIWGSDVSFINQASQLGRVVFAQIPLTAKRKILAGNAARALGVSL